MKKHLFLLTTLLSTLSFSLSNLEDIKKSSLVIYNTNQALVWEQRALHIPKGETTLIYKGVATTIDTDSVFVNFPKGIELYSQQFHYDQLTLTKLLSLHINKKVFIKQKKNKLIEATLLNNYNPALVRTQDHKIISVDTKKIVFQSIPSSLLTKPSLVWNIETTKKIDSTLDLHYLIRNISFKSDYILQIKNNKADLFGWLNIKNNSGKSFQNTQLSLLAGEINTLEKTPSPITATRMFKQADTVATHKPFEGYHLYRVPFLVDIANNENTQIKFIEKKGISIQREYISTLHNPLFIEGAYENGVIQKVAINKLDTPLPKGIVRIYGLLDNEKILLGESRIAHTPKNTPVVLTTGKNLDLKGKEEVIGQNRQKHFTQTTLLYTLFNSSDETKKIKLHIPFTRDIKAKIDTNQKYRFVQGNKVEFTFTLKPNETKKFQVKYEKRQ